MPIQIYHKDQQFMKGNLPFFIDHVGFIQDAGWAP